MNKICIALLSLIASTSTFAGGFVYSRINASVTNDTEDVLDVYCQASDPWYKCHHGEVCVISSWPIIHLKPGETRKAPLWISSSNGSEVKLNFIQSDLDIYQDTSQYTLSRIESGLKSYGHVSIVMGAEVSTSQSQNIRAFLSDELTSSSLLVKVSE